MFSVSRSNLIAFVNCCAFFFSFGSRLWRSHSQFKTVVFFCVSLSLLCPAATVVCVCVCVVTVAAVSIQQGILKKLLSLSNQFSLYIFFRFNFSVSNTNINKVSESEQKKKQTKFEIRTKNTNFFIINDTPKMKKTKKKDYRRIFFVQKTCENISRTKLKSNRKRTVKTNKQNRKVRMINGINNFSLCIFTYIRHWAKQSIAIHYTRIFKCEWSKYGHNLTVIYVAYYDTQTKSFFFDGDANTVMQRALNTMETIEIEKCMLVWVRVCVCMCMFVCVCLYELWRARERGTNMTKRNVGTAARRW